jgi:hypothetical protein
MQFFKRKILLSSFADIHNLLKYNIKKTNYFSNKIAIKHEIIKNINIINIWNIIPKYNYWHEKITSKNFIININYTIGKEQIKIESFTINDKTYCQYSENKNFLSEDNSNEIKKSIIIFIENIAKANNKNKIIIDVHDGLEIYNKYYKECFQLTNRRSLTSRFWLEAEKNI